jgi:hypothetical protein
MGVDQAKWNTLMSQTADLVQLVRAGAGAAGWGGPGEPIPGPPDVVGSSGVLTRRSGVARRAAGPGRCARAARSRAGGARARRPPPAARRAPPPLCASRPPPPAALSAAPLPRPSPPPRQDHHGYPVVQRDLQGLLQSSQAARARTSRVRSAADQAAASRLLANQGFDASRCAHAQRGGGP